MFCIVNFVKNHLVIWCKILLLAPCLLPSRHSNNGMYLGVVIGEGLLFNFCSKGGGSLESGVHWREGAHKRESVY